MWNTARKSVCAETESTRVQFEKSFNEPSVVTRALASLYLIFTPPFIWGQSQRLIKLRKPKYFFCHLLNNSVQSFSSVSPALLPYMCIHVIHEESCAFSIHRFVIDRAAHDHFSSAHCNLVFFHLSVRPGFCLEFLCQKHWCPLSFILWIFCFRGRLRWVFSFDVFHKNSRLLRNICESYLWFVHFLQFPKKKKRKKRKLKQNPRGLSIPPFLWVGKTSIRLDKIFSSVQFD